METKQLICKARQGDKVARDKLILENQGLIWSVAKRFLGRGYDSEDIYQIGCIGLIKAVDNFDVSYDVNFSTYAVPMIMGEIRRFLRDDGLIKVSRKIKENQAKIKYQLDGYIKKNGEQPTVDKLCKLCDLKKEEVLEAMSINDNVESLYQEKQGTDNMLLIDTIVSDNNFENKVLNKQLINDAINELPPYEKEIIKLRFFQNKTQSQVGKIFNTTQVQISRHEKKILAKIKNAIEE